MNKKISRLAVLPLTMLMLVSCGSGSNTTSAGSPATSVPATTSQTIVSGYTVRFSSKAESWSEASYTFDVITDGTVVYTKAEIKDNTGKVVATDVGCAAKKFTGLLAGSSFIFTGYFTVDGEAHTEFGAIATNSIVCPGVTTKDDVVAKDSISGTFKVFDPDGVFTFETCKLFLKSDTKNAVATSTSSSKFNFTSLTADTDYRLYLGFNYDPHNGDAVVERDYWEDFKTLAA
jgi:hypothetical protein